MSSASSIISSTFSRASTHALSFSSASSISSPFSGLLHVDRHGFLKSSHRAGGPVLTSLPAWTTEDTSTNNPARIQARAREILGDLKVEFSAVALKGRISKVDPEPTPIPTVVIIVPDVPQPDLWYKAVRKIHRDLDPWLHGISVEIIEEKLYNGLYCFPVEQTHSIYSKWETIAKYILSNLNIQEWTSLQCWRYGSNCDRHLNPVTIIVEVLKTSTESFYTAAQTIRGLLEQFHEPNVDILFMKDGKQAPVEETKIAHPKACRGAVYSGVSLGIHDSSARTCTLGGLVQIRLPNISRWHTYGLTCFHAVWPPEGTRSEQLLKIRGAEDALSQWEYGPLKLTNPPSRIAQKILKVDQPSLGDIEQTIAAIDKNITAYRTKDFLELEAAKKAIDEGQDEWMPDSAVRLYEGMASHLRILEAARQPFATMRDNGTYFLGYVAAGSGLYRTRGTNAEDAVRMDWALINITPDRLQTEIHDGDIPCNQPFDSDATASPQFLLNPQLKVYPGMELYKTGRSIGTTRRQYNGLKSVNISRARKANGGSYILPTWEHSVSRSSIGEAFSETGDSGSWVYTARGEVFGMLNAGNMRLETASVSCIFDIFNDIKELTGASEVRIAPSLPFT
ncbi:uncharacterized protein PGRI_040400 [Penicillium griseofulvum]|uniref:Peptidase S64, Ssy5 n=1 Tax=Penicillium patulum TaxID=5078 RepID=A0A135L954_PENPA|nr:uncharacterized protein PGRI_040400 [Penicillium griseofulvum]KXG45491.1 hypothetical protein PGRI_040400 [Penicillium griseofulvum]